MPSKAVVLVVVSFLTVILIYGPLVTFDVFAKPKLGPITCHTGQGVPSGQTECCQPTLSSITGRVLLVFCTTCDDTTPPSNCSPRYLTSGGTVHEEPTNPSNSTGTPPLGSIIKVPPGTIGSATNVLPPSGNNTGTPPTLTITKEQNAASPNVFSSAGNATNPSNNTSTLKLSPLTGQHHHKGSNVTVQTGGLTNTGTNTGSVGQYKGNSPTPPACPDKGPIPPNCTMKPVLK